MLSMRCVANTPTTWRRWRSDFSVNRPCGKRSGDTGHYYEEGLIPQELYDDLQRGVVGASAAEPRPRFDIGLDTHRLIERLDLLSGLDERQLDRVARLLRPRFTVPNERIVRKGDRGDAVFFIVSGSGRGSAACRAGAARQRGVLRGDGLALGPATSG